MELRGNVDRMGDAIDRIVESQRKLSYILDPANSIDDIRRMLAEAARIDAAPKP
jgi:hypothetical protein